ncbi:MAG: hypothetical protein IPN69_14530 [Acidobacteria bacterium]|nr:hypothetical protein [Acidobacteriota bacterium]
MNVYRKELIERLGEKLGESGFRLLRLLNSFIKKGEPKQIYTLYFTDRYEGYEVDPVFGLRFEEVENLFHRVSGFEEKYKKDTHTVTVSIENLTKNPDFGNLFIKRNGPIDEMFDILYRAFVEFGLPFFDANRTLSDVDRLINSRPEPISIYGFEDYMCYRGIVVAKLADNPRYAELVEIYRKKVEDFYRPGFESLVEILESKTY